ncbi:MAG: hypothetical protein IJZ04_00880 [Clostridia bacterium]|nr:hypothetical protein [Clostridia bacterium]
MENLKIYGIIVCAVAFCVIIKHLKNEYSLFIRLSITVGVSILSVTVMYPVLSYISEISRTTVINEFLGTLLKALGIATAVQITADTCKDAGEDSIANRIYLLGQAEIIVLSLPVIKRLLALCEGVIS